MNEADTARFDALLEQVIDALPPRVAAVLEEVPVVVLDVPTPEMLRSLEMETDDAEELCGLHTGVMATDRSIEDSGVIPSQIHLFREGIAAMAGGFGDSGSDERVREQIRITLLHEIGHEFGLDEDDLRDLGYD